MTTSCTTSGHSGLFEAEFVRYVRPNVNDDGYVSLHSNWFCITLYCRTTSKGILVWADTSAWKQTSRSSRRFHDTRREYTPACVLVPHSMLRSKIDHPRNLDLITAWKMRIVSWADRGNTRVPAKDIADTLSITTLITLVDQFNREQPPVIVKAAISGFAPSTQPLYTDLYER